MTADASTLRCPGCGAAAGPDTRRCPYCRARLATISCPTCFALMFDTAAYCQACGTRRARGPAEAADLRCPACREALARVDLDGTLLHECGACDGVWVDAAAFERICASQEAQRAVLHQLAERTPASPGGDVRYRPCPACGKLMNRVNFGRLSGAVVDVCRGHGTFLDAGELQQIVAFIQAGGLDKARRAEIDELRAEQQRLAAAQRAAQTGRAPSGDVVVPGVDTRAVRRLLEALFGRG